MTRVRAPASETDVRAHLDAAEIVPLAMSVVQLSGERTLLDEIAPHVRGPWENQVTLPQTLASTIRDRAAALVSGHLLSGYGSVGIDSATLHRMMSIAAGEAVEEHYVPMLLDHVLVGLKGHIERHSGPSPTKRSVVPGTFTVLIVGAGASGLCAAIQLGHRGVPYTILEKNGDVGGTWYENRYPGCAVDLPSHHYEYSFERNDDWPDYYSKQPSVLAYLARCAEKYGTREHIRFGKKVESAVYDEERQSWTVTARNREGSVEHFEANAIIFAVGQLNQPAVPRFEGLEQFQGLSFHTAAWPADTDLRGRRVALIGTGPSAVQVGPAIAEEVAMLHVFQRSGSWVAKRPNVSRSVSASVLWVLHNVPYYAEWYRFRLFWAFGDSTLDAFRIDPQWPGGNESISEVNAKRRSALMRHIRRELEGREDLLAKVVPRYPPFCKRVIADPGWYRMLRRANVSVVDATIARIEGAGIRTGDDAFFPVDVIAFATGFHADHMMSSMEIRGRRERTLRSLWGEDNPRAYLGMTVPEFPNLFVLYGPNSNFAHGGSAIFMAECQVNYIVRLLEIMAKDGHVVAEIRKEIHDRYNARMDAELETLAWSHPAAHSWYRNASGRVVTNQPWRLVDYWHLTRSPEPAEYLFEGKH